MKISLKPKTTIHAIINGNTYIMSYLGCEYSPLEPDLMDIPEPLETVPGIDLNNLYGSFEIGYPEELTNRVNRPNKLISVVVIFEGNIIHHLTDVNEQQLRFYFNPSNYPDGIYDLTISIVTGSGTGSLVETLGMEGYMYELRWPVKIDNVILDIFQNIVTVDEIDGKVEMSWPEFSKVNSKNYQLWYKTPAMQEVKIDTTVEDRSRNMCICDGFLEGQTTMLYTP